MEEQERLIEAYQAKWREESMGRNDFIAAFSNHTLDIQSAQLVNVPGTASICIQGELRGEDLHGRSCSIFIRAQGFSIEHSSGNNLTLAQFLQLGNDYWEAWSKQEQLEEPESSLD